MTQPLSAPNTPEVLLLRHGETQWNREGRYQGQQDSPLTLTGIGQVRAIATTLRTHIETLGDYQMWSSPLTRARQSASVFCEQIGLSYGDVRFDERLMERNYGRWEGLTMAEIADRFPEDVVEEKADRWSFAIPGGGESFVDVAERLKHWLNDVSEGGPAVVMAHGGSGRVLRGLCSALTPEDIFAFNDSQSTAFMMSNQACRTINADPQHLRAMGLRDAGLGVRI